MKHMDFPFSDRIRVTGFHRGSQDLTTLQTT